MIQLEVFSSSYLVDGYIHIYMPELGSMAFGGIVGSYKLEAQDCRGYRSLLIFTASLHAAIIELDKISGAILFSTLVTIVNKNK